MSSVLTPYRINTYPEDEPSLSETEMSLTKTTMRYTSNDMRCDMWTKEWLKYPIKWLKMAKMPENKTEIGQNTPEKQI